MSAEIIEANFDEERIADLFAEREALQLATEDQLRKSNLYGAAMLSFQHVLVSLELGDRVEAQSCMTLASVFAKADVLIAVEASIPEGLDTEESVTFTVPLPEVEPDATRMETDVFYRTEIKALQAVHRTVAVAEADVLVGEAYVEPAEKNDSLANAIKAVCDYIFMDRRGLDDGELDYDEKNFELLLLANELASHLVVNKDIFDTTATEIAFDAYRRLTLTAVKTEGRILPVLSHALQGFKAIRNESTDPQLSEDCNVEIHGIRMARGYYLRRNGRLPFIWAGQFAEPGNGRRLERPRTAEWMQDEAAAEYLHYGDSNNVKVYNEYVGSFR